MEFRILSRELVYRGFFKIYRLRLQHTLFRGGWSPPLLRELADRGDSVAILPYDRERDVVVMVEQFRVGPLGHEGDPAWMLEIPAGMVEAGESEEEVARRELFEETGCQAKSLRRLFRFYTSPGGSSERITLFYAEVDSRQAREIGGSEAEGEELRVHCLPRKEALARLERGEIDSAIPIIALQWLARSL